MKNLKTLTVTLMALLAAAVTTTTATAQLTLPPSTVCFTSSAVYEGDSYLDITLSRVPPGYDVSNTTYPGWCVEAFNFEFTTGFQYCGATLLSSTGPLPPHLADIP